MEISIEQANTITMQLRYLIVNTINTRLGLVCFYHDKILIAGTAEEMHQLLDAVWR